jgi:hypothetical protein
MMVTMRKTVVGLVVAAMLLTTSALAVPYTPDDPKPARSGEAFPMAQQTGGSCAIAAAANTLAAAGWGPTGQNAQQRAESIYNTLFMHYYGIPPTDPGAGNVGAVASSGQAMTWYLWKHGCSGASAYYHITRYDYAVRMTNYTNPAVTPTLTGGATAVDYDTLRNELDRCQYVTTAWYWADHYDAMSGEWEFGGHCMSLVGGDPSDQANGRSGFSDSNENTQQNFDNQFIPDAGEAIGRWELDGFSYSAAGGDRERLNHAYTLCPGKPKWAIAQYDVAWDGVNLTNQSLIEGGDWRDIYDDPTWQLIGTDVAVLNLDNARSEQDIKQVFVELDFKQAVDPVTINLGSKVWADTTDAGVTVESRGGWHFYDGNSKALAKWVMEPQPEFEHVTFDYDFLLEHISTFNVATYCIPEPAAFGLLVVGLLTIRRRAERSSDT